MFIDPLKLINYWPPFLGAGIKVKVKSNDYRAIDVSLKYRWWNKNYVGVQFGGAMYSMTDPFYMLMLMKNLGVDYIVWDKAAYIQFIKPGRSKLMANFRLSQEQIDEFKNGADNNKKFEKELPIKVLDEQGDVIAEVKKMLYVRRKDSIKNLIK